TLSGEATQAAAGGGTTTGAVTGSVTCPAVAGTLASYDVLLAPTTGANQYQAGSPTNQTFFVPRSVQIEFPTLRVLNKGNALPD
ncbi:MAG: hypothetical protein ACRDZN_07705, partial [Acidimicrobiales bacterium]